MARSGDGERTDRPRPGHQHAPAGQRAGPVDGVEGDGERLAEGGLAGAERGADRKALRLVGDERFGEGALDMREAHGAAVEAHVETVIFLSGEAEAAMPAGPARIEGDAVARLDAGHAGADG